MGARHYCLPAQGAWQRPAVRRNSSAVSPLPTHKLVHLQSPMPIGAPATCSFLFLDPSTHNLAAFARKLNPRSIARSGYATILHLGKGETNMKNKDG
jgi:hypothetical protein